MALIRRGPSILTLLTLQTSIVIGMLTTGTECGLHMNVTETQTTTMVAVEEAAVRLLLMSVSTIFPVFFRRFINQSPDI